MYEAIKNFAKQFLYEPEIINGENLAQKSSFVLIGMGGSGLPSGLLKTWKPSLPIITHHDYGLPDLSKEESDSKLFILSSYSGNTEEVIEAFHQAKDKGLPMAVIAVGGKLLTLAEENKVPHIKLPDTGIQPRMAVGFSTVALLKIMGEEEGLKEIKKLTVTLEAGEHEAEGKKLAAKTKGFVPVIYSSARNLSIAYNWKIKLNETGKIPAFYNVLSELNHNEMTGFDVKDSTKELSKNFHFILLKDGQDNPRISRRMEILSHLYQNRNLPVESIDLDGGDSWHKIFSSLLLADWFAYYTAGEYGVEAEQVPMVEEFKKLISQ